MLIDRYSSVVVAAMLVFGTAGFGLAQNTNSGDIRGTVADSSGAIVRGAPGIRTWSAIQALPIKA